ncbi:hypothetical protein D3C72_2073260 [compost metagenome]
MTEGICLLVIEVRLTHRTVSRGSERSHCDRIGREFFVQPTVTDGDGRRRRYRAAGVPDGVNGSVRHGETFYRSVMEE